MVGISPLFLEKADLFLDNKDKSILEIERIHFRNKEAIQKSGLVIYSDGKKFKIIKSKYKIIL